MDDEKNEEDGDKNKILNLGATDKVPFLMQATSLLQLNEFGKVTSQPSNFSRQKTICETHLQFAQPLGEIRLGVENRIRQILLQTRVLGNQLVQPLHVRAHRAQ